MRRAYVTVTEINGAETTIPFVRFTYEGESFCVFVRESVTDGEIVSFSPSHISLPIYITLGLGYFTKAVLKAVREYPSPTFELHSTPRTPKIRAVCGTFYGNGGRSTIPVAINPALWLSLIHTAAHIGDLAVLWEGDSTNHLYDISTFAKWRVRRDNGAYALFAGTGETGVLTEEGYNTPRALQVFYTNPEACK